MSCSLSRIQFALTIMFHYIFPPLSIGLGSIMVFMEGMYLRTGDLRYHAMTQVLDADLRRQLRDGRRHRHRHGVPVRHQLGRLLALRRRRLRLAPWPPRASSRSSSSRASSRCWCSAGIASRKSMHFFATLMVALGSIFSAVWIVVANSWQQTPAGHVIREHVINGHTFKRAEIIDFWAMVFNPSTVNRLVHVLLGAFLLGAFFVMSISAWYLLKSRHDEFARRSFTGGLMLATICSLAQLGSGHFQAAGVAEHQPAKLAAMEGIFTTEEQAPMHILGWPDEATQTVRFPIEIPGLLSFLAHGSFAAPVAGSRISSPNGAGRPYGSRFRRIT